MASLNNQKNRYENSISKITTFNPIPRLSLTSKKKSKIKKIEHFLNTAIHNTKQIMAVITPLFTGIPLPTAIKLIVIHVACSKLNKCDFSPQIRNSFSIYLRARLQHGVTTGAVRSRTVPIRVPFVRLFVCSVGKETVRSVTVCLMREIELQ